MEYNHEYYFPTNYHMTVLQESKCCRIILRSHRQDHMLILLQLTRIRLPYYIQNIEKD